MAQQAKELAARLTDLSSIIGAQDGLGIQRASQIVLWPPYHMCAMRHHMQRHKYK